MTDRLIGCPHEEGIDYPMGRTCPRCPFWANIDRITHEPIARPEATMSPAEVLEELGLHHSAPPLDAFESADAHRAALTNPLLEALERGLQRGRRRIGSRDTALFTRAVHPREVARNAGVSVVLRWLALPMDTTERPDGRHPHGGRRADSRGGRRRQSRSDQGARPGIELPTSSAATPASVRWRCWLRGRRWIARQSSAEFSVAGGEGLEREPKAMSGRARPSLRRYRSARGFPELRRAHDEGLIDAGGHRGLRAGRRRGRARGEALAETREREPPIDDVAEATAWWGSYDLDVRAGAFRRQRALSGAAEDRPQRTVPVRQREEIQEVLRRVTGEPADHVRGDAETRNAEPDTPRL